MKLEAPHKAQAACVGSSLMKIRQKWIGNPRQDFWTRFYAAVEQKTDQKFAIDRIPGLCDYPNSLKMLTKEKRVAYLTPHELYKGYSPVGLNKPFATYWLEVEENEPFYDRVLDDLGIKLEDFWDGEPHW